MIIGDVKDPLKTKLTFKEESIVGILTIIESTSIYEALLDDGWILVMQEELNMFKRGEIWDMVSRPEGKQPIGSKWVFRNKQNEKCEVIRNIVRLVAQGYCQLDE